MVSSFGSAVILFTESMERLNDLPKVSQPSMVEKGE